MVEYSVELRAAAWAQSTYTGISSLTIWSVMTGKRVDAVNVPLDLWDFGRCHRLLERIPEWKPRLHEVAQVYPEWAPFLAEWDSLSRFYEEYKRSGLSYEASDSGQRVGEIIQSCLRKRNRSRPNVGGDHD